MTKSPWWLLMALAVLATDVVSTPVINKLPESTFSANDVLASFTRMAQTFLPDNEDSSSQIPEEDFEIRVSGFTSVIKAAGKEDIEQPARKPVQVQQVLPSTPPVTGGSRYMFLSHGVDWFTAKAICEKMGTHLVIINSEGEAQLLEDLFAEHLDPNAENTNQMWVGFSDIEEEGRFVSVLGEDLSTVGYADWYKNQPDDWKVDNTYGEDCMSMRRDKLLNDLSCLARLAFVCEA